MSDKGANWIDYYQQINIRGTQENEDFCQCLQSTLNLALPTKVGQTSVSSTQKLMCLGPDEWLLVSKNRYDVFDNLWQIKKQLTQKAIHISIVDLSHARDVLLFDNTNDQLNHYCPLDFSTEAFPVNTAAQSKLGHIDVIFYRLNKTQYELYILQSMKSYTDELLSCLT
ncbi:sarcosine oxidase subunit gamma [Facilibium subflavum]|uniref:sarcosine oxidase subunit gamma n=1 Tax=Facilibium subflavum TaxID=2219058 RepID=UPI000E65A1D4|nr:sarcosine oxidase subunit gamma family protein [Facilibium subflavum]